MGTAAGALDFPWNNCSDHRKRPTEDHQVEQGAELLEGAPALRDKIDLITDLLKFHKDIPGCSAFQTEDLCLQTRLFSPNL